MFIGDCDSEMFSLMISLLYVEEEEEKEQMRLNMMSPSKNVLQTPGFKSGRLI